MNRRDLLYGIAASVAAPAAAAPTIETLVGDGRPGYTGDGGLAARAQLNQPFQCARDRAGNLFVADTVNHCIRKVERGTGVITTVAGSGRKGYSGDGGPATAATMNEPYGVMADRDGHLFIVDRLNAAIRRVDARTGIITTYAGTGMKGFSGDGGPAVKAEMREPNCLDFDPRGHLYVADVSDNRIRRIDRETGIITTVAGTGRREFAGDGGPAAQSSIHGARALSFARDGSWFICEREGNRIRRVDGRTGLISTIAGTGAKGYAGDGGPASAATLNGPKWITWASDKLHIVDTENHAIRVVDLRTGTISTVAGGRKGPGGDGGPAADAGLDRPHGSWVDRDGAILIGDTNNHRIRIVRP